MTVAIVVSVVTLALRVSRVRVQMLGWQIVMLVVLSVAWITVYALEAYSGTPLLSRSGPESYQMGRY
jgi:multisubunit Na+/H+ antiporter MnhB subunit